LKKNVLIPGFELICKKCNQKNWNSVNELKEIWRCDYCNSTNRIILQLKTKAHLQLRYRKSGLFSKDNNQEGAIPAILTLIQLNTVLHSLESFVFTTSLNLTNNLFKREIDFCLLNTNRYDGEIEIGIAESKSEGGNIDIEDIEFMKLVRDKFQENNIECYLIFSKTSDQFTFDEIKLFEEELYKRDVPFILFTNKELEPYRPYDKYPKNKTFKRFVFSLKDMAQNTSSVFKANTNINP
jgi:DNA-directed RNA polymerase subunit RPC12/RpoP